MEAKAEGRKQKAECRLQRIALDVNAPRSAKRCF